LSKFIAIAGNIGVGKSSLVGFMQAKLGFHAVYEPFVDNPYLDLFYQDMKTWAFHSQLYFLTQKFKLHLDVNHYQGTLVQDRTIYEDAEIFARNLYDRRLMGKRDYQTYSDLYDSMQQVLRPPDLLIYLRCSVRAIRRRIKKRGRPSEQTIPTSYLRSLNRLYESWVDGYDKSPILIWDSERMDYLTDMVDQLAFQEQLQPFLEGDDGGGAR
jgi:deoxyadenosine/deoxycytidine kinase